MRRSLPLTGTFVGLIIGLSGCPQPPASTDDETSCIPGEEGCACNAGQCLGDLICLSDLCVEEPVSPTTGEPTTGDPTSNDDGPKPDLGGDGMDDGMVDPCMANSDCAQTEACVDGACYDTNALYFDVFVDYFLPTSGRCDDGLGDGVVELFYRAYMDDVLQLTSSNEDCPAVWTESWVYDSLLPLRLDFWEEDLSSDDLVLSVCWQDSFMECAPVPKSVLHEGVFYDVLDGHEVGLSFYPRLQP